MSYFRPPGAKCEARKITIRDNTIVGGMCGGLYGGGWSGFREERGREPGQVDIAHPSGNDRAWLPGLPERTFPPQCHRL